MILPSGWGWLDLEYWEKPPSLFVMLIEVMIQCIELKNVLVVSSIDVGLHRRRNKCRDKQTFGSIQGRTNNLMNFLASLIAALLGKMRAVALYGSSQWGEAFVRIRNYCKVLFLTIKWKIKASYSLLWREKLFRFDGDFVRIKWKFIAKMII